MTTATPDSVGPDELKLYSVKETMTLLNLGKTTVFEQIRTGRLRSVKRGRSRLIPATAIREYIALLEKESQEAA